MRRSKKLSWLLTVGYNIHVISVECLRLIVALTIIQSLTIKFIHENCEMINNNDLVLEQER